MLELPIHRAVKFILVAPHYPENLGAACRAIKTMGFSTLGIVNPGRLALPDHPMAEKMAVKSLDVLSSVIIYENLDEAVVGSDLVVATTARRGVSGVLQPPALAALCVDVARKNKKLAIVFGNEKSGLTADEVALADVQLRVPMAADQPSLNLAQAVQIVAYQLFQTALDQRADE